MTAASTTAVVGYRRSRRNILGTQARVITVRDGVLRVIDQHGAEQERLALSEAEVRLKRGLVEVAARGRSFFLYGLGAPNKLPEGLIEQVRAEPSETGLGPADGALGAAAVSQAVLDLLIAHGARRA